MNVKTMKFIDETVGPLVCFAFFWFNALKKIFLPSRYKIDPSSVKNILVIKFFGIGSVILAGPILRALRGKFADAKITILTFSSNKEICQRIKLIDDIVIVDSSSLLKFIITLVKGILYIRKKHCEISIDLEFFAKSSTIIQYLCNTRVRVGYYIIQIGFLLKMLWRGNLLTHNVYYNPHRHTSETFLALARSIGADTADMSPATISIYDNDRRQLGDMLKGIGVSGKEQIIIMNINASELCLERRWPLEKFIELTEKILNKKSEVKIILIGSETEIEYVNQFFKIIKDAKRIVNLAGKLTIGMLVVLLQSAKIFITNDSGPLHIAASLGVPTISFFGPEIPERFGPKGEQHTVFYSGIYCSPCLNVYNQKTSLCKGENECMRQIPVESVFNIITERYLR